jgi:hypothetical protein
MFTDGDIVACLPAGRVTSVAFALDDATEANQGGVSR